jgi:hypothetical protein
VKLELLEVFGVACLAVFAAFVWLPACVAGGRHGLHRHRGVGVG